jgi:hypothetical protein
MTSIFGLEMAHEGKKAEKNKYQRQTINIQLRKSQTK